MMIGTEMTVLLKGGKMRYVPMSPELASELRHYPVAISEDRIFPPKLGATSGSRDWTRVSKICRRGQRFGISGSTICGTPLPPGT